MSELYPHVPRPPQSDRRTSNIETEYKLVLLQAVAGAVAFSVAAIVLPAVLSLIGLQLTTSFIVAWVGLRGLRWLRPRGWRFRIINRNDELLVTFGVDSLIISGLFVAAAGALVAVVAWFLFSSGTAGLRMIWLPVWFVEDWLVIFGRKILPAFGPWTRGTLTVALLGVEFFALELAYRMALEVFNPNWPPTFSAALAEWGPFWWTWNNDDEPEIQEVVRDVITTEIRRVFINGDGLAVAVEVVNDENDLMNVGEELHEKRTNVPGDWMTTPQLERLYQIMQERIDTRHEDVVSRAVLRACGGISDGKAREIQSHFEDQGWLVKQGDAYKLTTDGRQILAAYNPSPTPPIQPGAPV